MATKRKAQDTKIEDALAKKMGKNNAAAKLDGKSTAEGTEQAPQDAAQGDADKLPTDTKKATEAAKAAAAESKPAAAAESAAQAAQDAPDSKADAQAATAPEGTEDAAEAPHAVEIKPAPGHALVTYTGYVNLRTAPSTSGRIAGRVGRGDRLAVLGTAEGDGHTWYALPGGLYIMGDAGLLNFCPQ